jgi:hypothetical protein
MLQFVPFSPAVYVAGSVGTWLAEYDIHRTRPLWDPNDIDVFMMVHSPLEYQALCDKFVASFATSSQSTTSQQVGYPRLVLATLALTNGTVTVRFGQTVNSGGIFVGSSKFSSGSGRGTFIFSLPTYLSTQRLFVGYTGVTAAISGDPTGGGQNNIPLFGIGKDAADTTLQFIMNDNSGTPTKVNTGVVPNTNDVYRVTCYVSPDNRYYIRLQVSSKTAAPAVYVHVPTSKIPPVGTKLVFQQTANNGTVGGVISIALIQIMEELY